MMIPEITTSLSMFSPPLAPLPSAVGGNSTQSRFRGKTEKAFSLIEVTLAIGLAVFSALVVLGLLPVGMRSLQDSAIQQGLGSIARQIRGDLQQIPFVANVTNPAYGLDGIGQQEFYYTREGVRTEEPGGYFRASFALGDADFPGATATLGESAKLVRVTVNYPLAAPETAQQQEIISLFVARQDGK
jgi:uncharacterized protein (TIGR02598 family)